MYVHSLYLLYELPPGIESRDFEFPDEIDSVISYGAKGIGLYRSEYLYLMKEELPSEDEEFEEYYEVAEKINPNPVIIRTLDLGGDKQPRCINFPEEENPFLGLRAIRFSLERQDIFVPSYERSCGRVF